MTDAYSELATVVQAWPKLPPNIRVAILRVVQAMAPGFIGFIRSEV